MKTTRFTALFLALIMLLGVLAGCGDSSSGGRTHSKSTDSDLASDDTSNDSISNKATEEEPVIDGTSNNDGTLKGTVTLKQFLDSDGPKVGLYDYGTPGKNNYPDILLFENGKIYMVCTWEWDWEKYSIDLDPTPCRNGCGGYFTQNKNYAIYDGMLTWGDISKMTDEELLEYARANKQLLWGDYPDATGLGLVPQLVYAPTGNYSLHIYTDYTGNNRADESLEIECEILSFGKTDGWTANDHHDNTISFLGFTETTQATIYSSVYSGVTGRNKSDWGLYFRTGGDLTITLDNIGDEGILID